MSNVAHDYPARREVDSCGERVWFRPAIRDANETWGWTADPAQAHPDYQVKVDDDGRAVTWVGDPWGGNDTIIVTGTPTDAPNVTIDGQRVDWAKLDNALSEGYVDQTAVDAAVAPLISTTTVTLSDPIVPVTTTTEKGTTVTQLAEDGTEVEAPRFTEWSRYPLPPLPPRAKVSYDGYGRYKLPSPSTGRPTGFSRATTIASTLEETYNLNRWKRRQAVKAIISAIQSQSQGIFLASPDVAIGDGFDVAGGERTPLSVLGDIVTAVESEDDRKLDAAVDLLDNITGGRDAAELGEAVHAWLEAVDCGTVLPAQVPEQFQPYVTAYRAVLARHGLVAVAEYVERIVLNDQGEETVVGTIDRIYRVITTGALVLGDVKTSKTLEYSWLPYAVQFAVYGYATKMFRSDGDASQDQHGWEPMPELDLSACYCLHVPSDQPERAACITFDLFWGGTTMIASLEARRLRKAAAKAVPFVHEIPVPSKEALRYVEARDALLDIPYVGDLPGIYEAYEDVWTDDLTELGMHVAQLLQNAAAPATA